MLRGWLAIVWLVHAGAAVCQPLVILAYHDVRSYPADDRFSVRRGEFVEHLEYLRVHGFQPVSLEAVRQAVHGEATLPERAVLLTFDDGLKSFATFVLPVLELYGFPAVVSVVTAWLDGEGVPAEYEGRLMDWDTVRRISRLAAVAVVSHSHDLHHGIPANPQGDLAPAGRTRRYDPVAGRYETEAEFARRVRDDLARSLDRLEAELGQRPYALAWPYGDDDQTAMAQARRLGIEIFFTLREQASDPGKTPRLGRILVMRGEDPLQLLRRARQPLWQRTARRFVELRLDAFDSIAAPAAQRRRDALLERLRRLGVNTVFVSPFTSGEDAAFFATGSFPVAGDVLSWLVRAIKARTSVDQVILKLPAFVLRDRHADLLHDLVRLVPYDGVLLPTPCRAACRRAAKRLAAFRPDTLLGRAGHPGARPSWSFSLRFVAAGTPRERLRRMAAESATAPVPALLSLQIPYGDPGERLVAALKTLQNAGARHYGYGIDRFLIDSPQWAQVAPVMAPWSTVQGNLPP